MALFTGSREQQLAQINKIPTDAEVRDGLAIRAGTKQEILSAFANGNYSLFDSLVKKTEQNFSSDLAHTLSKLSDAQMNLANSSDYSGLSAEQAAKEQASLDPSLQKNVDNYTAALSAYAQIFPAANIPAPEGYVRTPSGFQLTSEVEAMQSNAPANMGKTGEGLKIRQSADGSYEIYGVTSGTVYGSAPDLQSALSKQTEIQSGAKPDATGAFDVKPAAGGTPTTSKSSILDGAGVNYNGLTDTEVKDLEALYQGAGDDQSIMDKVFQMQEVTAEDTKNYYDKAKEFISGKGSAYEQMFTRAKENYERTLENQALERESQMEQEKLAETDAIDNNSANAAESGLAFSGIRAKAQNKIQEQAANIAESSRRSFDFNLGTYQRETEDYLGSANLAGAKLPSIMGVDAPQLTPGIRGSLERQQEVDVQQKADDLQAQANAANQEILAGEGKVTTM